MNSTLVGVSREEIKKLSFELVYYTDCEFNDWDKSMGEEEKYYEVWEAYWGQMVWINIETGICEAEEY